jgi:hypothetical protein
MLPLIYHTLNPPVIVCKNEELYAAALIARASARDNGVGDVWQAAQWWLSLSTSASPLMPPAGCRREQRHGQEAQEGQEGQEGQEAQPLPPARLQSRRMHGERRTAALRKAFNQYSSALLQACQQQQQQQQHSAAASTLASLDAQRLVLLQQCAKPVSARVSASQNMFSGTTVCASATALHPKPSAQPSPPRR